MTKNEGDPDTVPPEEARLRKRWCKRCPFVEGHEGYISEQGYKKIFTYLEQGQPHDCNMSRVHICRGARNWQLMVFHRKGFISEPTDEALFAAMTSLGIPPKVTEVDDVLPSDETPEENAQILAIRSRASRFHRYKSQLNIADSNGRKKRSKKEKKGFATLPTRTRTEQSYQKKTKRRKTARRSRK